jgi:hypothetical protein
MGEPPRKTKITKYFNNFTSLNLPGQAKRLFDYIIKDWPQEEKALLGQSHKLKDDIDTHRR